MVSKRSAGPNSGSKGGPRPVASPASAAGDHRPPSSSGRSRSKQQGWPWWLWAIGAFALIMSLGRILASERKPKLNSSKSAGAAGKKAGSSTARYLELALRLQEMTEIATTLELGGALDSDAAKALDKELSGIEGEIADADGSVARDLRSMVSVVRGTLYQKSQNLTDEQVEKQGNSFTYANPRYWDDYYNKTSQDEVFDWYGTWDTAVGASGFAPRGGEEVRAVATLGDMLQAYLRPEHSVLMFGCGNSDLSEKMYAAGFEGIVNIDISAKLLENLRSRLGAAMPKMRWMHMDASSLSFPDGEFDVTIDKGTLDAIEQNWPLLQAAAREAHRTLRPGGYLLSVTFNNEQIRVQKQLREAADWGECHSHEFEKAVRERRGKFFVHACRKRPT